MSAANPMEVNARRGTGRTAADHNDDPVLPPARSYRAVAAMYRTIPVVAAAALLCSCRAAQTTLVGHGPAASRIAALSWAMTILFVVVTAIMWALLAWSFVKRRGTLAEHEPITAEGGEMWIVIGGMAVPFIVLTVLFVLGLNLLADFPIHGAYGPTDSNAHTSMAPEIRVTGHQWWWQLDYLNRDGTSRFTTANELHLPAGRPVYIEVVTADVMHSFWIPALHGKVDLIPGLRNDILIDAPQPGDYVGQCAEYCGVQHSHMRLLAVVQPPDAYDAWLEHEGQSASNPTTAAAQAGKQVFLSGPCATCHQIRGVATHGTGGPDLTHVGSRRYLAADSLPNNYAYMEAWVTNAQSLKPGALMPSVPQFNGVELRDLTTYLRQLQ